MLFVPGLGPHGTGRTGPQRLVERLEVAWLSRDTEVWLLGRRSPLGGGTTIASLAEEHARAIRARFDGPVDVVGESTGGSVALQLASDHPDVVQRLVIVSAASSLAPSGRVAQRDIAASLRAGRPRRAAGIMLAATSRRPIRSALLRAVGFALGRAVIGRSDDDLIATLEAEDAFDVRRRLARVSAPTVVLGGADDGYYSPRLFGETAALIPGATYVEYARRGHVTAATHRAVRGAVRTHLRPERTPGPS